MISDPRMAKPVARLIQICDAAEILNDPRTANGTVGGGGKPGSQSPGETQCDWLPRELERVLARAVRDAEKALKRAMPKEHREQVVKSIGGVTVGQSESEEPIAPYRTRRPGRTIASHLARQARGIED